MHRSASGLDYGEFEFVYHLNNHLNPFWSFLSLLVKWKTWSFSAWQNPIETKSIVKWLKWFNGKRIQTRRHPCYTPTRCRSVHVRGVNLWMKNCGKSGLGRGPPGHRGLWVTPNLLGWLWSNISGCVVLRKSENRTLVQDHLNHGASKEPKNHFPEWIHWFLWCTVIQVILDQNQNQKNAPIVMQI